ncbi:MAG: glutathione S-transferase family protein [Synechococcaceae bacterium WB6_3B_236]|jgi:glutathione S-transferase|nr:glutathione S-transferase family protein [Synechococcaceae bacterium WB6_3B_236]
MRLYQFRHSSHCEKVRLVLAAKGLAYTTVEVTPGLGQWDLFRQSGHRQVPVLEDGHTWVGDSSAIALHLETSQPQPPLLPADPGQRAQVLLLEDWADTTLAAAAQLALAQTAATDRQLRTALLPDNTPLPVKTLAGALPLGWIGGVNQLLEAKSQELIAALEQLSALLRVQPYLIGEKPSLADIAVAAQLYLLRFPAGAGLQLSSRGVGAIANRPDFEGLFSWRDGLYRQLGRGTPSSPDRGTELIPLE